MPSTPMPETSGSLDERVYVHREELTVLMADAGRCDDISSGILGDLSNLEGTLLSDRRLKCDVVAVDWSR